MIRVVCAIIIHENRILLAQRAEGKHLAGHWEFPGGKVEPGEEPAAALKREIHEELGCTIHVGDPLPSCVHAYDRGSIQLLPFICDLATDSAPRALEHSAIQWVSHEHLTDYDLAPADVPILPHLADYLSVKMRRLFQK
jgi:8-oxo-dGTP diphosphatase